MAFASITPRTYECKLSTLIERTDAPLSVREKIDRLNTRFNRNRFVTQAVISARCHQRGNQFGFTQILNFDRKYSEDYIAPDANLFFALPIKLCLCNENIISLFLSVVSLSLSSGKCLLFHVHRSTVDMQITNRWNAKIGCDLVAIDRVLAPAISNSPLEIGAESRKRTSGAKKRERNREITSVILSVL